MVSFLCMDAARNTYDCTYYNQSREACKRRGAVHPGLPQSIFFHLVRTSLPVTPMPARVVYSPTSFGPFSILYTLTPACPELIQHMESWSPLRSAVPTKRSLSPSV